MSRSFTLLLAACAVLLQSPSPTTAALSSRFLAPFRGRPHAHAIHARRSAGLSGPPGKCQLRLAAANNNNNGGFPTSTSPSKPSSTTSSHRPSQSSAPPSGDGAVINVASTCGDIGATPDPEVLTGPNGSINWINCGVGNPAADMGGQGGTGGWNPPKVTLDDIIYEHDLRTVIDRDGSPFKACTEYVDLFERIGDEFNIPSIILASFAMQESSCNPSTMGGGGEAGMMQISPEKCANAPNGDCLDVEYNVRTAASYFRNQLDHNDGSIVETVGNYNGWFVGMTYEEAIDARNGGCCRCQKNLDYVHAFFNGWMQGINAYNPRMGQYFNLDVCK